MDIEIDDRLPTQNGKLVYLQSTNRNEFWTALLEKAYAKLYNGYENLKGGHSSDAMVDLTGGLAEYVEFKKDPNYLKLGSSGVFDLINKSIKKGSICAAAIQSSGESYRSDGLVVGHAYSITAANEKERTITIRNVWGQGEYKNQLMSGGHNGFHGDTVHGTYRNRLPRAGNFRPSFIDDGEFLISDTDFYKNFTKLEFCHLDSSRYQKSEGHWHEIFHHGEWKAGVSSGGSRICAMTYFKNPFYIFEMKGGVDSDEMILSLTQKYARQNRLKSGGHKDRRIGFDIYKMNFRESQLETEVLKKFYWQNKPVFSAKHVVRRDLTCRVSGLAGGKYIAVCSTYHPNKQGKFLLRMFTEQPINATSQCLPPSSTIEKIPKPINRFTLPLNQKSANQVISEKIQNLVKMSKDYFYENTVDASVVNKRLDFLNFSLCLKKFQAAVEKERKLIDHVIKFGGRSASLQQMQVSNIQRRRSYGASVEETINQTSSAHFGASSRIRHYPATPSTEQAEYRQIPRQYSTDQFPKIYETESNLQTNFKQDSKTILYMPTLKEINMSKEILRVLFTCSDFSDGNGLLDIHEWCFFVENYLIFCDKFFEIMSDNIKENSDKYAINSADQLLEKQQAEDDNVIDSRNSETRDSFYKIPEFKLNQLLINLEILPASVVNSHKYPVLLSMLIQRYGDLQDHHIYLKYFLAMAFRLKKFVDVYSTSKIIKIDAIDYRDILNKLGAKLEKMIFFL